jgi:hypothetical protein
LTIRKFRALAAWKHRGAWRVAAWEPVLSVESEGVHPVNAAKPIAAAVQADARIMGCSPACGGKIFA